MVWYIITGLIVFAGFTAFTGAPYVPSKPREVKRAFTKLYKLSAKDVMVDIGSGDGLVLRAARRQGARAVGYEINPVLVLIAKWMSRHDAGVEVRLANFCVSLIGGTRSGLRYASYFAPPPSLTSVA